MLKKSLLIASCFTALCAISQTIPITQTGSMSVPRFRQQAELLFDGRVIAMGGDNNHLVSTGWVLYNSVELYNPVTQLWSPAPSMSVARTDFGSVVLNDGRVLVIGGRTSNNNSTYTNSCEIYNPFTNSWSPAANFPGSGIYAQECVKLWNGNVLVCAGLPASSGQSFLYDPINNVWSPTGNCVNVHSEGASAVLLNDGRVLLTGGNTQNGMVHAEIYNPNTGLWTNTTGNTTLPFYFHSSVVLPNGNVMLVGSSQLANQTDCEIYQIATGTFYNAGDADESRRNAPSAVMDNGWVLNYQIGDFTNFNDTKCVEYYDPVTDNWLSGGVYSHLGTVKHTMTKLNNGNFLIAGGDIGASNPSSAHADCWLLAQPSGNCTPVLTSLSATGQSVCFNTPAVVTITGAEANATYTAFIAGYPVSTSANGPGNIQLNIAPQFLQGGSNLVSVRVQRSGCLNAWLNDTAMITMHPIKPVLIVQDTNIIYACDSVALSVPLSYSTYQWSTGAITPSITVNQAGTYYVQVTDGSGCPGVNSDSVSIYVNAAPLGVNAGVDITTCEGIAALQLSGTPGGGNWSGSFIDQDGTFSPAQSGYGSFTVTYSICNTSDTRVVSVDSAFHPQISIAITSGTNPTCPGNSITFTATTQDGGASPTYSWKRNTATVGNNSPTYTIASATTSYSYSCVLTSSYGCVTQQSDTSNVIVIAVLTQPQLISTDSLANQVSVTTPGNIALRFSAPLDSTSIIPGVSVYSHLTGYKNSLMQFAGSGTDSIILALNATFLPGEEVTVSCANTISDTAGCPSSSAVFEYRVATAVAPGLFVPGPQFLSPSTINESITAADFNGDGAVDFAVSSWANSKVWINDGTGMTFNDTIYNFNSQELSSVDFDADGDIDIIGISGGGATFNKYENNGLGVFTQLAPQSLGGSGSYRDYDISDFDGNGKIDYLNPRYSGNTRIVRGYPYTLGGNISTSLVYGGAAIDYDGNYWMDIVAVMQNGTGATALVAENVFGNGTFLSADPAFTLVTSGMPTQPMVFDCDNDGDQDFVCGHSSGLFPLSVSKNDGAGNFTVWNYYFPVYPVDDIVSGDWDGDGDIDIAGVNGNNTIDVFGNDGTGQYNFTQVLYLAMNSEPSEILSSDFDGDGDLDLLVMGDTWTGIFFNDIAATTIDSFSQQSTVLIAPNPTNDKFTVYGKDIVSVDVYDCLGQQVTHEHVETTGTCTVNIDLSDQMAGLYSVIVNFSDRRESVKVIKGQD